VNRRSWAVAILVAWLGSLGWLTRRQLFAPPEARLIEAGLRVAPGAAYYRLAVAGDARGAFNIAAEPVLDPPELARILGARLLPVPRGALRTVAAASWRLRLQPTPPGWVDLALGVPLLDVSRARAELGWEPRHSSGESLLELIGGIHDRAGAPTPPLDPHTPTVLRAA